MNLPRRVGLPLACLLAWAAAPARAIDPFGPPTEEDARRALERAIGLPREGDGGQARAQRKLPVVFTLAEANRQDFRWYCDLPSRRIDGCAQWVDQGMFFQRWFRGEFVCTPEGRWEAQIRSCGMVFGRLGPAPPAR